MSNRSCHWLKSKVFYSWLTLVSTFNLTTICTTNRWLTTRYQVIPNFSSADSSYSKWGCNWKWRKLTECRAKPKKSLFYSALSPKKKEIKSTKVSLNTCLVLVRRNQQISKSILINGVRVKYQTSTIWTFLTRMHRGLPLIWPSTLFSPGLFRTMSLRYLIWTMRKLSETWANQLVP